MKQRKRYSAEFRVQAVELLKERLAAGSSIKRVGEELELNPDLLWAWSREVDQAPPGTAADKIFPGFGRKRSYTRRELERLRQERDFLEKAAAFFAKESR